MTQQVYVYCIATRYRKPHRDGFGAPIKIGVSAQPNGRLCQLQTGSPNELGVAAMLGVYGREAALVIERTAHERFAKERMAGEWFDVPPDVALEFITDFYDEIFQYGVKAEKIPFDSYEDMLVGSGIQAVRDRLANERYLRAWENAA